MFFNMYGNEEEEKKEEKKGPAAPSCYGCLYMVASPMLDCTHPNSVRVLWDPIRNRSYRIPSIPVCREHGGICKFYEPSPDRGAEYSIIKEYEALKKDSSKGTIEERVDTLITDLTKEGVLEEFLNKISERLIDDIREEDVEEEDEG